MTSVRATLGTLGLGAKTMQSSRGRSGAEGVAGVGVVPETARAEDVGAWARFLDEFAERLRVEGYAPRLVGLYPVQAGRLAAWLHRRGRTSPATVTPEDCLTFQRALYYYRTRRNGALAVTSQVSFLTAVRAFTRFLKRAGYALVDPGLAIESPRTPRHLPRDIMNEDEISALLLVPDTRTLRGYRDRTMLEVLYGTGLRIGELLGLDVVDANVSDGWLHIRDAKWGADRVVPMGRTACEYVGGYLTNMRPRLVRSATERALFVGMDRRSRMSHGYVFRLVRRYVRRAGIEKAVSPHSFRHTCATHLLRGGAEIRYVQAMLGHRSLATTERYTKVEIGDLAAVHERCHPRERL